MYFKFIVSNISNIIYAMITLYIYRNRLQLSSYEEHQIWPLNWSRTGEIGCYTEKNISKVDCGIYYDFTIKEDPRLGYVRLWDPLPGAIANFHHLSEWQPRNKNICTCSEERGNKNALANIEFHHTISSLLVKIKNKVRAMGGWGKDGRSNGLENEILADNVSFNQRSQKRHTN